MEEIWKLKSLEFSGRKWSGILDWNSIIWRTSTYSCCTLWVVSQNVTHIEFNFWGEGHFSLLGRKIFHFLRAAKAQGLGVKLPRIGLIKTGSSRNEGGGPLHRHLCGWKIKYLKKPKRKSSNEEVQAQYLGVFPYSSFSVVFCILLIGSLVTPDPPFAVGKGLIYIPSLSLCTPSP